MFRLYVKYIIYAFLAHFVFNKEKVVGSEPKAFLFSCPDHGNVGDIAIERAETNFLKARGLMVKKILVREIWKYLGSIKNAISEDDIVCIQGGGSFGGLYLQADLERILLFKSFKKTKIISFPQSIFYTNDKLKNIYKRVLKKRNNVYLFFRERNSYLSAINDFDFMKERIFLVPDIVMFEKRKYKRNERSGIVLTFRGDKERTITDDDIRVVEDTSKKYGPVKKIDTLEKLSNLSEKNNKLDNLLLEYSRSKLVITDRLHGMILSYITNTPCIAVTNNNGKVKSEYETWLKECAYILFLDEIDSDKIKRAIDEVLFGIEDLDYDCGVKAEFDSLHDIFLGAG